MQANHDDLLIGEACRHYGEDLVLRVEGPFASGLHKGMYVASLWLGVILLGWTAAWSTKDARLQVEMAFHRVLNWNGGKT